MDKEKLIECQKAEIESLKAYIEGLETAVNVLPIDDFVTVEPDGACYVDFTEIDAADFKDNSTEFANAMAKIKAVQIGRAMQII